VDQAHTYYHLLHFTCIYVRSLETEVAWLVNITNKEERYSRVPRANSFEIVYNLLNMFVRN